MRVCLVHVLLAWVVTAAASSRSLIIDGPGLAPRSVSNAQGRLPTRVAVAASCSDVERFAAGLLVDRLNSASSSSAFPLVTEGGVSQQLVIAVGFGAASALGTSVVPSAIFQQLSQDDDAYFLALAPGGSIALAAGRTSGRGAVNAVYGFLRDGLESTFSPTTSRTFQQDRWNFRTPHLMLVWSCHPFCIATIWLGRRFHAPATGRASRTSLVRWDSTDILLTIQSESVTRLCTSYTPLRDRTKAFGLGHSHTVSISYCLPWRPGSMTA